MDVASIILSIPSIIQLITTVIQQIGTICPDQNHDKMIGVLNSMREEFQHMADNHQNIKAVDFLSAITAISKVANEAYPDHPVSNFLETVATNKLTLGGIEIPQLFEKIDGLVNLFKTLDQTFKLGLADSYSIKNLTN